MSNRRDDSLPDVSAPGRKGTGVYPAPPKGFDPLTASPADLARHGLPLRPDPRTQPDLAALWDRLAERYRDYEHLDPQPIAAAAGVKDKKAMVPFLAEGIQDNLCGLLLQPESPVPFTVLSATWTVPDLWYSAAPNGVNHFAIALALGSAEVQVEMSVDPQHHVTSQLAIKGIGTVPLPASPGDVISGVLCQDTGPAGPAHYFLANQTTLQTVNYAIDMGQSAPFDFVILGVTRDDPARDDVESLPLARFGVVFFDEISVYTTGGRTSLTDAFAIRMVESNGQGVDTLAEPDMIGDDAFKVSYLAAL